MISDEAIRQHAVRNQTSEENVVREYVQCAFLGCLYRQRGSEHLLFKGGTALRLAYQSPRYSEDLDYTASDLTLAEAEGLVRKALGELRREGVDLSVSESKATSGGYLMVLEGAAGRFPSRILVNISLRSGKIKGEAVLITNPLAPAYTAYLLPEGRLAGEKIDALLSRKKPRDFFDVYFLARKGVARREMSERKESLKKETSRLENKKAAMELKSFLPQSFWPTIRNLRENLLKELERL